MEREVRYCPKCGKIKMIGNFDSGLCQECGELLTPTNIGEVSWKAMKLEEKNAALRRAGLDVELVEPDQPDQDFKPLSTEEMFIREELKKQTSLLSSIKSMLKFFTILTVIGLIISIISGIATCARLF